jgi:hypothetical protein
MKRDIVPLCDRDHAPMQLSQFRGSNIGLTFVAYKCTFQSCSRTYHHGSGYIDVTDVVSYQDVFRRDCAEDDMSMYLAEIDPRGTQTWRCGQVNCDYSEQVTPHERYRVMIKLVEVQNQEPSDAKPFTQLEAIGISSGTKWIGRCCPWEVTLTILSSFGQSPAQLIGIRNSLLGGTTSELVGREAPLGVTEQQLRKAGLTRLRPPKGSANAIESWAS